jgi:hypothetical protein
MREPVTDPLIELESHFGSFGNVLCIRAGSHEESKVSIAEYITKSDPMADDLVSELFQSHPTDCKPSRFFASAFLQDQTPTPWPLVATQPFPYRNPPRTTAGIFIR